MREIRREINVEDITYVVNTTVSNDRLLEEEITRLKEVIKKQERYIDSLNDSIKKLYKDREVIKDRLTELTRII